MCCFEQILEVAPNKTTAVQSLTSILTNHPSKMNKTYWALLVSKDEFISNILLLTPTHRHTSVCWPAKTYQLCLMFDVV